MMGTTESRDCRVPNDCNEMQMNTKYWIKFKRNEYYTNNNDHSPGQ